MLTKLKVLIVIILVASAFSSHAGASPAEWTVLVYLNADNNLEPDSLRNFAQMANVGSNDKVNVVVEFDRIAKYVHTNPDWANTFRFLIKKDMLPLPFSSTEDLGEVNMGSGSALKDFVSWGKSKYPAKKYMLIIWDHGQGWRKFAASLAARKRVVEISRAVPLEINADSLKAASGVLRATEGIATSDGVTAPFRSAPGSSYRSVSNDETNGDVLYNREIADALKAALGQERIDVIGFDACLMGMLESGYAFHEVAKYMVASQELEPGAGWRYDTLLASLMSNPGQDGQSLAAATVNAYATAYTDASPEGPETTLSAVDLSKAKDLTAALSTLSDVLISKLDQELQAVIEARAAISTYAPGLGFHHVDLYLFLQELRIRTQDVSVRLAIDPVLTLLKQSVIANHVGSARKGTYGSNGIAIYFPANLHDYRSDPYSEGGYERSNTYYPVKFVQDSKWTDFLHAYWARVP